MVCQCLFLQVVIAIIIRIIRITRIIRATAATSAVIHWAVATAAAL